MDTLHLSGEGDNRYDTHFGVGNQGANRLKEASFFNSPGAEQERYGSHFGLDEQKVKHATQSLLQAQGTGAEQDRYCLHFGLGHDGWERAKHLANKFQGSGAEQVSPWKLSGIASADHKTDRIVMVPISDWAVPQVHKAKPELREEFKKWYF